MNIRPLQQFMDRVSDPDAEPLTWEEARTFYKNISRMSASQSMKISGGSKHLVTQFTHDLGEAIRDTATEAGKGQQYNQAMRGYRVGIVTGKAQESLLKKALPSAVGTIAGAGAAGAAYKVYEEATK